MTLDAELEPVAARWWPPAETAWLGPWLLRAAGGFTMRASSVGVFGAVTDQEIDPLVDGAEAWYGVAARGALHVHVMVSDRLDVPGGEQVLHSPTLDERWVERWWSVSPRDELLDEGRALLDRVPAPRSFARTAEQPLPAAVGLAAVVDGWAGLGAIAVAPQARRRGLGRAVTAALLAWAAEAGAGRAFLQVSSNNGGAIALYEQLGFRVAYDYRYWMKA